MSVDLRPASEIKKRLGIQTGGPAHAFLTHTCRIHMDKYVPYSGDKKQGDHLRENVTETVDSIIYEMPYAHAQYVGYTTGPVVNYTTAGTGPYWDELMKSAELEEIEAETQDYINRHGGR